MFVEHFWVPPVFVGAPTGSFTSTSAATRSCKCSQVLSRLGNCLSRRWLKFERAIWCLYLRRGIRDWKRLHKFRKQMSTNVKTHHHLSVVCSTRKPSKMLSIAFPNPLPQVGSEKNYTDGTIREENIRKAMPSKRRNNGRSKHGRGHTVSEKARRCKGFLLGPWCCCCMFFLRDHIMKLVKSQWLEETTITSKHNNTPMKTKTRNTRGEISTGLPMSELRQLCVAPIAAAVCPRMLTLWVALRFGGFKWKLQ